MKRAPREYTIYSCMKTKYCKYYNMNFSYDIKNYTSNIVNKMIWHTRSGLNRDEKMKIMWPITFFCN